VARSVEEGRALLEEWGVVTAGLLHLLVVGAARPGPVVPVSPSRSRGCGQTNRQTPIGKRRIAPDGSVLLRPDLPCAINLFPAARATPTVRLSSRRLLRSRQAAPKAKDRRRRPSRVASRQRKPVSSLGTARALAPCPDPGGGISLASSSPRATSEIIQYCSVIYLCEHNLPLQPGQPACAQFCVSDTIFLR
jgi:hypothetical protein